MKVTLVQPYYFNIWEPIGLGYIASYCKKHFKGHVDFNFYQSYFDSNEKIIDGARDSDVVAFSCTSPTFKHGVRLAKRLKRINPKIRTVFGGHHVSALKDMITEECIDQIVVGEGEKAFLQVLEGNKDKIVLGQTATFEELPWPDRELINNRRTVKLCYKMIGRRITSFQANRVCPFRCKYCAEKAVTGVYNRKTNPIRSRNVSDLMDEIEFVADRYQLDFFKFVDATFNVSAESVISFCEEKIRRNFDIEWECMIHAAPAEKEMFPWLKRANCKQIDVGCESGSPTVLKHIRKGTTVEKIMNVFDWAKECDIKRRAFFILGIPIEKKEDILMTKKLAEKIEPDVFGVTILCPYPGCDYYDHKTMKDIAWEKTDEYSNDFWHTENFSNSELKQWQQSLTKIFNANLAWHHRIIDTPHTILTDIKQEALISK
jgi:anaerobic magnesium-protoporphyrin IX monomethyl ester cyclase